MLAQIEIDLGEMRFAPLYPFIAWCPPLFSCISFAVHPFWEWHHLLLCSLQMQALVNNSYLSTMSQWRARNSFVFVRQRHQIPWSSWTYLIHFHHWEDPSQLTVLSWIQPAKSLPWKLRSKTRLKIACKFSIWTPNQRWSPSRLQPQSYFGSGSVIQNWDWWQPLQFITGTWM